MNWKDALAGALVALVALFSLAPAAMADAVISGFGSAAGKTFNPQGIAVDASTGSLYVADENNNRIDVFDSTGHFAKAFGWGVSNGAAAFQTCTTTCRAGIAGAGSGQFARPTGAAVDNDPTSPSFGSLYVYDFENRRVQKFTPDGAFALTFGGGVNKTTGANLCVAGSGNICGAGSEGGLPGEFGIGPRPIATGPGGTVYVGDSVVVAPEVPEEHEPLADRVQLFTSEGTFASQLPIQLRGGIGRITALAVDSEGSIFLNLEGTGGGLRKYDGAGNLIHSIATAKNVDALAVDGNDDLFVAEEKQLREGESTVRSIVELDRNGAPLRRFAFDFPEFPTQGLAPFSGPNGDLYASEQHAGEEVGSRVLAVSFPAPGPIILARPCANSFIGSSSVIAQCGIDPEGSATTTHFQFIDQAGFEAGGFGNPGVVETPEGGSIGDDFELHAVPLGLEGLEPETTYHYRVVATNADGGPVFGPESTFTTRPPLEIGESWTSQVGSASALLKAEVDPIGNPATGFFEFVDDARFQASGFAEASRAPAAAEPIDFGSGEGLTQRSAELSGLTPGTTYHYRLVASNSFTTAHGPVHLFRTSVDTAAGLPDSRAYELVSPAQKGSAEAGGLKGAAGGLNDSGFTKIQQGSADGEALTFTSFTSFGDPKSAPGTSQYLARRTAGGWTSRNITPAGHSQNPLQPPSRGFTPDLGLGAMVVGEPPLTPEADPNHPNLYLQNDDSGALQLLSLGTPTVSPLETDHYCVGFGGASDDGRRAFFLANGSLTANAPVASGFSLYEWSAAGGVRLVSVLPGEVPAQPAVHNGFGAQGKGCGTGETVVRHAVSADGSRVFWTFVPKSGATRLIARVNGAESVQLDAKQGGTGNAGNGLFAAASADGSRVVFMDNSKLVPGAGEGGLYRYDFAAAPGSRLTDLTPGPQAAGVQGVLGASDDTSAVYFVATGVLSEAANSHGDKAVAGKDNLYVWREGQGVAFVATLDAEDKRDWSPEPHEQTARVSPDGSTLAFVSRVSLTGYDNLVEGAEGCQLTDEGELLGDPRCNEAYLFDAASGTLSCASCDPTFARPRGPASLPTWFSPFQQPRYLSADGSRLFFQTLDGLDPHDTNGRQDVYELERAGVGSCTATAPTFSAVAGGCLFLVSTGHSSDESFLLDASEDGRDVFLSTRQQLVGQDIDERYDVYDARTGGGFAPPSPEPGECAGEECRPGAEPPPGTTSPGSTPGGGGGNVHEVREETAKPVRCRRGTHRVTRNGHARCVRNPKPRKPHRRGRAHGGRRAGR